MPTTLSINVGGSAFSADWHSLPTWRVLLDNADSIAIQRDGEERVRVDLGGLRRWIAFSKCVNGSPLYCIGYQETVGAVQRSGLIVAGSNRKVTAWLHPSGRVTIGEA